MQVLRPKGKAASFWAIELAATVPEMADCGETWEPPGFRLGPHLHRHWELLYLSRGEVEFATARGRFVLRAGSVYCLQPHVNHWVQRSADAEHHVLFVGFDLPAVAARHPEWRAVEHLSRSFHLHEAQRLEKLFHRVIEENTVVSRHQAAGVRLALDALVLELVREVTDRGRRSVVTPPGVARVIEALQSRFREPWTLARLAAHAGLSRSRLHALFSEHAGLPPHRYLNAVRARQAALLLQRTDLSVAEVGRECGFANGHHFARVFKQVTGQTPTQARRPQRRA